MDQRIEDARRFINVLKRIKFIERRDLEIVGGNWDAFRASPHKYLCECEDHVLEGLWRDCLAGPE